jgi:hypothetical protein
LAPTSSAIGTYEEARAAGREEMIERFERVSAG